MVKWSIEPDKWVPILKVWTSMTPAQRADAGKGVTLIGRWHDVNARCGVAILEVADAFDSRVGCLRHRRRRPVVRSILCG